MTNKNNVVDSAEFAKKREALDASKIISSLGLNGNDFKGSIVIEQTFQSYNCKVIFNFNGNVIVVKEDFSIYEGIDLEVLTARVAEELAIHILVDTMKDALTRNDKIKYWLKRSCR